MSESPAVSADDLPTTARVDSHLQRWRTETQRRRNAWAVKQADFVADQRRRRERTLVFAASASFGFVATLGVAVLVASQWSSAVSPFTSEPASPAFVSEPAAAPVTPRVVSEPAAAPPVAEAVVEEPVVEEPVVAEAIEPAVVVAPTAVAPAEPVVPSAAVSTQTPVVTSEPTPAELGATSVTSWARNGTLWIQVDTVAGREIRWLDAAGNEALERTPCAYPLAGDAMRCYVGRTRSRIDMALAEGATPGTWSAELCDGDACTTVATYPVRAR